VAAALAPSRRRLGIGVDLRDGVLCAAAMMLALGV